MSVCGQTEEDSGSEEPVGAGAAAVRDMYEQKAVSKVVRVLTVLAYLLSVSLAAILLSVYYVCVWQSPKLPLANETGEGASRQRADPPHGYAAANYNRSHASNNDSFPYPMNETRGGDSTVSETITSPPSNLTSLPDPSPSDTSPWELNTTDSTLEDLNATTPLPYAVNATDQR